MSPEAKVEARRAARKRWKLKNPEKVRAQALHDRANNRIAVRAYYAAHREEIHAKSRAYRAAHPDRRRAACKRWALSHPEKVRALALRGKPGNLAAQKRWREKHPERDGAWRKRNPELARAARIAWVAAHPESRQASRKRWKVKNPAAVKAHWHTRRARLKAVGGSYTAAQLSEKLASQRGDCPICRLPLDVRYHIDHIVPLALGGLNVIDNIQLTHPTCNLKKGAKLVVERADLEMPA